MVIPGIEAEYKKKKNKSKKQQNIFNRNNFINFFYQYK